MILVSTYKERKKERKKQRVQVAKKVFFSRRNIQQ